jgi:hypothetical protein
VEVVGYPVEVRVQSDRDDAVDGRDPVCQPLEEVHTSRSPGPLNNVGILDPGRSGTTGEGLPVTRMFAVVALVELVSDSAGVYGTSLTVTWGDGDE